MSSKYLEPKLPSETSSVLNADRVYVHSRCRRARWPPVGPRQRRCRRCCCLGPLRPRSGCSPACVGPPLMVATCVTVAPFTWPKPSSVAMPFSSPAHSKLTAMPALSLVSGFVIRVLSAQLHPQLVVAFGTCTLPVEVVRPGQGSRGLSGHRVLHSRFVFLVAGEEVKCIAGYRDLCAAFLGLGPSVAHGAAVRPIECVVEVRNRPSGIVGKTSWQSSARRLTRTGR